MTTIELARFIGRRGLLSCDGMMVEVVVTDVKERWGITRYLVEPVAGFGGRWVEQIKFDNIKV